MFGRLGCAVVVFGATVFQTGCSQNMVLGNKIDARPSDGGTDSTGAGTGGARSGGSTGTGGSPGSGGTGGAASGTGGALAATGGRGSGGSGGAGASEGTGGRGGGNQGTGGQGTGGASDGGAGCNPDASLWCASGQVTAAGGVSCGDALTQPVCSAGQWTCPTGWMPLSECDCAGHLATNCTCTPNGPSCPDGGTDAATDAGVCDFGCYPTSTTTFCGADKVTWECFGPSINESVLINGGCTDAVTGAIRYCCAASFLSQCPPRV